MPGEDEEELLRSAAMKNAESILRARRRVLDELRETKDALEDPGLLLELLNHTGAVLASTLELENIVQAVTDAGTKLSGADFGAFFYTQKASTGEVFTLYTLAGAPREAFEKFGHPRNTPIFAPTFAGQGVVRIADVTKDPRYGQWAPHHGMPPGHLPVCSYLAVPVASRTGVVIGGLFFGHKNADMFTARTERVIVGMAAQAAVAIDNARLFEESQRSADAERAARSEVERVSLMKDEFLATLSHELRTPLNAVLGWAEMLMMKKGDDPEIKRGLETIARNARAQAQMIEDLLDMNRIISGKIRLDVQRVDVAGIVETALDSTRPSLEAKAIRLVAMLDPSAGPIFGDPHRIQQVIWNLLSNAVKFTPKGGKIDVVLRRVNSHVEITVTDSGIGIKSEFLPHLWERFRQADSSTTRKYGGLGLGLSIVKQIVELHGGTVRAESAGLNTGSTFTVSLPLRAVRADEEQRSHPTAYTTTGTKQSDIVLAGVKVLVVDDDDDARRMVDALLRDAEATVTTASSADEALRILGEVQPDVIVSDIGMPDRDGYQFMRDVRGRATADGGKTPAIALTAFARSEDRTRALLAGYQVHIAKPIEPHELIVTIASLTGRTGLPD